MTSVLNVDTIADKAGTGPVALTKQSAAKAFAQFAGDGTAQINESFGMSSLSDTGAGLYVLTVSSAMSSSDYTVVLHGISDASYPAHVGSYDTSRTTTTFPVNSSNSGSAWADVSTLDAVIFGDLA
jgi:hypothetical protein